MSQRRKCTVLALIVSLLFTLCYFTIFTGFDSHPQISVVQDVEQKELKPTTLYWIQLGVFKEKNSYASLIQQCESAGLSIIQVNLKDKVVIVAQCSENQSLQQQGLEKLKGITSDYILKEKTLEEETALMYLEENNIKKVLEEFVYY